MVGTSPWWSPERHADRRAMLAARGAVRRALRAWFEAQDFTEVEAGQLVVSPGAEAHLHAFATHGIGPDGAARPLYLHTSPEFAAKKLLAAGETAIFDFARVFRNRERGPLHAPEFTMLEWYRAHAPWETVMEDACTLLRVAAEAAGARALGWRDRICDPFIPAERLSVADAFSRFAGIDLAATLDAQGAGDRDALAAQVAARGHRVAADDSWSDLFSRVLTADVEPRLGLHAPVLLHSYPACEAALARRQPEDRRFAERFELYACGVELANGFGELTDPVEQRVRIEAEMALKARLYGETHPVDEDFLAALAHMPPASGVALGFDRLVMLCVGARHIDQVMWTPTP